MQPLHLGADSAPGFARFLPGAARPWAAIERCWLQRLRILGATLAEVEKYAILTTLDAVDGSTAKTAEMLDISIRTVQYRLQEYGRSPKERPGR